jgi:hypothetical protein
VPQAATHPARLHLIFWSGLVSAISSQRLTCTCSTPAPRRCLRVPDALMAAASTQFLLVFFGVRFLTVLAASGFGDERLHVLYVVRSHLTTESTGGALKRSVLVWLIQTEGAAKSSIFVLIAEYRYSCARIGHAEIFAVYLAPQWGFVTIPDCIRPGCCVVRRHAHQLGYWQRPPFSRSLTSLEDAATLRGGLPRCALCIPASLEPALALSVQLAAVARTSRPQRAAASATWGTMRCWRRRSYESDNLVTIKRECQLSSDQVIGRFC